jgi:hypothetical protein
MSDEAAMPQPAAPAPSGPALPWFQVWIRALTRPGAGTFSELANRQGVWGRSHRRLISFCRIKNGRDRPQAFFPTIISDLD